MGLDEHSVPNPNDAVTRSGGVIVDAGIGFEQGRYALSVPSGVVVVGS